ncbi:MAG: DUF1080 domain-containing protein [Bacteroidales bacterium]
MKNHVIALAILLVSAFIITSCRTEPEWQALFNGEDLENWDKFLGTSLGPDFENLAREATTERVFSVVEADGEPLIRISGEMNGSLATREDFEDYHLRLVFRWGDTLFSRRNSGLLYHGFGDLGEVFGTWMPNIEFQLMHQNLGDTYLMANTGCETPALRDEETNQFVYAPDAEPLPFGAHANGRMIRKGLQAENPLGMWNTIDLYCLEGTSVHVVNGLTVMVNRNTGVFEDGVLRPLTSGKIQIQSEGAELFIKSIDIRPIDMFPEGLFHE